MVNTIFASRTAHVLVVGIDGIRYDSLVRANTPHMDTLVASGVLWPVQVHAKNRTVSGPVWATGATGVDTDRHGVVDNERHPTELAQLDESRGP